MQVKPETLEQHIAVFGESGSGKTVLLSSFYGATQESRYIRESLFNVVADDIGQGSRLHRNYLGMRNSATLPGPTRFASSSYSFSVKLKDTDTGKSKKAQFGALRLVWHDYPGEWFEQDVESAVEAERRVETFRSLLGSDVAFLLVDAQKMIDNTGEEERYLKSLFSNFRNGILSLKDDLLEGGQKLIEFPRIWVIALSKADLLPQLDAYKFRDLIVEKACDEVEELRNVVASMVEGSEALSIGEDFMLLSSAEFKPGVIKLDKRIGVKLMLPISAMLPFERHVRFAEAKQLPAKVAENLLRGAGAFADALVGKKQARLPGKLGLILKLVDPELITVAARLAGDKLAQLNADARSKNDTLSASLTQFKLDLDLGEKEKVLLRSLR